MVRPLLSVLLLLLPATAPAAQALLFFPDRLPLATLAQSKTPVERLRARTQLALRRLRIAAGREGIERVDTLWLVHGARITGTGEALAAMRRRVAADKAEVRADSPFDAARTFDRVDTTVEEVSWPLAQVDAPAAWALGARGQGVLVAVIDSGVDASHPDFGDRVDTAHGWNFETNEPSSDDKDGHGTAAAGLIAGATTGVAPRARILPLRVCCDGSDTLYESVLWEAMQEALVRGARVVSQSVSLKKAEKPDAARWRYAEGVLLAVGVLHANSPGNRGNVDAPWHVGVPATAPPPWFPPGQLPEGVGSREPLTAMVSVGAVDRDDRVRSYSPFGPVTWASFAPYGDFALAKGGLPKPELCAPSEGPTLRKGGGFLAHFGGTSSATPLVAGSAAVLLSVRPELKPGALLRLLAESAQPVEGCGAGRVDVGAAVAKLLGLTRPR